MKWYTSEENPDVLRAEDELYKYQAVKQVDKDGRLVYRMKVYVGVAEYGGHTYDTLEEGVRELQELIEWRLYMGER